MDIVHERPREAAAGRRVNPKHLRLPRAAHKTAMQAAPDGGNSRRSILKRQGNLWSKGRSLVIAAPYVK
ncbi:hypothetical protein GCM10017653_20720 [Ancylobacter defluvii]|uniref:Uncharacterized protein n=1 Tax=Ancylobacter defluvii TaxID=1282440 RepID=A0A9W6JVN4_9HYPH|nr:hypothetical protein GCM10017653_20720 [Ancylobacter defluvii]